MLFNVKMEINKNGSRLITFTILDLPLIEYLAVYSNVIQTYSIQM